MLREQLLDAAVELLERTGDPAAGTVRGVASRVGVAPNAVYLHFSRRDTLLAEAVATTFSGFTETLASIGESSDPPIEQLRAGHRAYMAFARSNPGVYRAMFGGHTLGAGDPDTDDVLTNAAWPAFEHLLGIVGRCIDDGALPSGVDRNAFARFLFTVEHGWSDLAGTARGALLPDPDDIIETLLSLTDS